MSRLLIGMISFLLTVGLSLGLAAMIGYYTKLYNFDDLWRHNHTAQAIIAIWVIMVAVWHIFVKEKRR